MLVEFPGPQPGDKVLLIGFDQGPEMLDLLRLVLGRRIHLTVASNVAEARLKLSEPYDLLWLRLPLPDLQAPLFIEHLMARPDLADRVGIEDMTQAIIRLSKMPVLRNLEPLGKKRDKWIWVRVRSDGEREWVRHLLEQCTRKDAI